MNDALKTGVHGRRLIKQFEKGPPNKPGVRLTADGAALDAYLCPAGIPTIASGICTHPNGQPVRLGDSIAEDQVDLYLEVWLEKIEREIKETVTIALNQNQFDAIACWVFNLGIGALRNSSKLLPFINAGRWLDAAAEMTVFVYSTVPGPNGLPWKRALFGLFIRRCCEACLLLGYDWDYACDPDRLALPTRRDPQPDWINPQTGAKGRYYDVILDGKTPFANIERDARNHPLSQASATVPIVAEAVRSEPPVTQPTAQAPASKPTEKPFPAVVALDVESAGKEGAARPSVAPVETPPPTPAPKLLPPPPAGKAPTAIAPKNVDLNAIPYGEVSIEHGAKLMTKSQRVIGLVVVGIGSVFQILAARGIFSSLFGAVFFDLSRDPAIIALITGGVLWVGSKVVIRQGTKMVTKGMVEAKQVLV
jgi:lysozyme